MSARTVPGVIPTLALVARKWSADLVQPIAGRLATKAAPNLPAEPTDDEYNAAKRIAERAAFLLVLDNRNSAAMEIARGTGITRGIAHRLIGRLAAAMTADIEGMEITRHLRAESQWPETARTIYDTCADWRAADHHSHEYDRLAQQRQRQQALGVDPYEIGSREDAIARAAEEHGTTRAAQEEFARVVLWYKRRLTDRQRFIDATVTEAARKRFRTLLAAFEPQPLRYTATGKPYPLTSDEREEQLSAWIDAISPQAIAFGESLRTLLDWPALYGPKTELEEARERRAARVARRQAKQDQQDAQPILPTAPTDDARTEDHDARIADARRILAASAKHTAND